MLIFSQLPHPVMLLKGFDSTLWSSVLDKKIKHTLGI